MFHQLQYVNGLFFFFSYFKLCLLYLKKKKMKERKKKKKKSIIASLAPVLVLCFQNRFFPCLFSKIVFLCWQKKKKIMVVFGKCFPTQISLVLAINWIYNQQINTIYIHQNQHNPPSTNQYNKANHCDSLQPTETHIYPIVTKIQPPGPQPTSSITHNNPRSSNYDKDPTTMRLL